jgi:peptidyl-prolyl cis-trans isomerase A (cyclophilin A)
VKIQTTEGDIVVELAADKAPITVANYLKYVDRGLFNGATFYRASRPPGYTATDYGSIQGGLQNDPKKVLPPIAHESTIKTGLTARPRHHLHGPPRARHRPGRLVDHARRHELLDADPKDPKNPGFAAFGHVVSGMDVVQKIIALPTDPNRGEGAMKGEMLVRPVRIVKVSRVPVAPPAPAAAPPAAPN